jgi:4-hydroxy-tetrahydrodipicolinate synthase
MKLAEGIIPVLITPFTAEQKVNERALRRFVERFIGLGVHGLFGLGTNGEFFALTEEEKAAVMSIVVEQAGGRVPVYAGTGANSTEETIALSRRMEQLGVDALSVITPYFVQLSQTELYNHYEAIASSTSLPIIMYNFPKLTGVHIEADTVARLAQIPNIVGIKDSSGNFDNIRSYIERTGPDFSVLAGSDALLLRTLLAGGKGGVSGSANVLPELILSIYRHWQNGNAAEAERVQELLAPLSAVYQKATLPSVFKEAMNMMGLEAGPCRLPISPLAPDVRHELEQVLRQYRELGFVDSYGADEQGGNEP